MQALLYLIQKEFRQIGRDHTMLRIIFLVPILQLFVFAYAANTDLRNVRLAVLDEDQSRASRELVEAFTRSDVFIPGPLAENPRELESFLTREEANLALWIPENFARDLAAKRPTSVGIAVDGQNATLAGRTAGYAQAIVSEEAARGAVRPPPGIRAITRFLYNPELESRYYMIPGIVVLLITVVSAFLTGVAVVREKEIGTLEQLLVTPITPVQFVAGKTIPFAIIAFFELTFATTIAVLWFHLPLRGSVPLLAAGSAAYLLVTLGIGLLASTVSSTQQQAMFTVWFFLVFGILMSGFFFPIENMPDWAQAITIVDPLRYMMDLVRGVFLKGAGFADLWIDLLVLAGMGLAVFSAAMLRFRKRLG